MRGALVKRRARSWAGGTIRSALEKATSLIGRDATEALSAVRLAIVVPHPDDETLGCGALLNRAAARGSNPVVVIVTDGGAGGRCRDRATTAGRRSDELRSAMRELGVREEDVKELGLPDGTLAEIGTSLFGKLSDVLTLTEAEIVITTSAWDPHPDHRALAWALRQVCAEVGIPLLEFFVWGRLAPRLVARRVMADRGWRAAAGLMRPLTSSAQDHQEAKVRALQWYHSQLHASAALMAFSVAEEPYFRPEGGPLTAELLGATLREREVFIPINEYARGVANRYVRSRSASARHGGSR